MRPTFLSKITTGLISAGRFEAASVEARRAGFYLQSYIPENNPHFDDPSLRMWLAAIWMALGDWEAAKVDLRNVEKLTRSKQVSEWLKLDTLPPHVTLMFDGAGPKVTWNHPDPNPSLVINELSPDKKIHYLQSLHLLPEQQLAAAQSMVIAGTAPWYQRHFLRNDALREIIMKSNYMTEYLSIEVGAGAQKSLGFALGGSIELVGFTMKHAVFRPGNSKSFGEAIVGAVGAAIATAAVNVTGAAVQEVGFGLRQTLATSAEKQKMRNKLGLETYRFVRFLPNWLTLIPVSHTELPNTKSFTIAPPKSKTKVSFVYEFE